MQAVSAHCVIGCNREQRNVASPFDCFGNFSLVCCAVAGNPARHDLAALGDKEAQSARFFVVNGKIFLGTKTAHLAALKRASFAWTAGASGAACRALAGTAGRPLI